jgi:hypothetical protein
MDCHALVEIPGMSQTGRRGLRIGMSVLVIAVVMCESATAFLIVLGSNCKDSFALHQREALRFQQVADSEIQEHVEGLALGKDHVCRKVWFQVSEDELREQRRIRAIAGRRAAYHRALWRKYERMPWRPWLALLPDPPLPD